MSWIMVDIEADGPIPGDYSMIEIGAVIINEKLDKTFYGSLAPISNAWIPDALKVTGHSREDTLKFNQPIDTMSSFKKWIESNSTGRNMFISDNNGFDWQFVNWYFHHFLGDNPFGFSSTNLGSFYKGLEKNFFVNFKHLRKTKHTHNPVDDAKGNAEAFLALVKQYGVKS
jgi:hypothetical protein